MNIKNFFKSTKKNLGVKASKDDEISKKKRLIELIEKLKSNKIAIKDELKNEEVSAERKAELEEELHIYKLQIKKGEEILEKKREK